MLSDIDRKVLRILYNFSGSVAHRRMPTVDEMVRKTGRREKDIIRSVRTLADKFYIEWDGVRLSSIKIVKAWEDQPIKETYGGWAYH